METYKELELKCMELIWSNKKNELLLLINAQPLEIRERLARNILSVIL
jgi:hypothetical protein